MVKSKQNEFLYTALMGVFLPTSYTSIYGLKTRNIIHPSAINSLILSSYVGFITCTAVILILSIYKATNRKNYNITSKKAAYPDAVIQEQKNDYFGKVSIPPESYPMDDNCGLQYFNFDDKSSGTMKETDKPFNSFRFSASYPGLKALFTRRTFPASYDLNYKPLYILSSFGGVTKCTNGHHYNPHEYFGEASAPPPSPTDFDDHKHVKTNIHSSPVKNDVHNILKKRDEIECSDSEDDESEMDSSDIDSDLNMDLGYSLNTYAKPSVYHVPRVHFNKYNVNAKLWDYDCSFKIPSQIKTNETSNIEPIKFIDYNIIDTANSPAPLPLQDTDNTAENISKESHNNRCSDIGISNCNDDNSENDDIEQLSNKSTLSSPSSFKNNMVNSYHRAPLNGK